MDIRTVVFLIMLWLLFLSGCTKRTVWKSSPIGDYYGVLKNDTREPKEVCLSLQNENALLMCELIEYKRSMDKKECEEGMSASGCIACMFRCS